MKTKVANISDFKDENILSVETENSHVVLCKDENGVIFALEDRCSHADVALSGGELKGSCIVCPAHGGAFELGSGKAICMPAVAPVPTFKVIVENSDIFIEE